MDDLARRLDSGSGRILLYGDPGIGKTRLLEELRDRRLAGERVHWIDLGKIETSGEAEIDALFENALPGDYLIADHFERGRRDRREQLIRNWAGVGRAKGLKMIVASRYYLFNELRRLFHQYHVRVSSIQQTSLNDDEVMAFLYSRLYGDASPGRLGMPMPVRKQILDVRGNLRRVLEIAAREKLRIEALPVAVAKSTRLGICRAAALLMLFALSGGLGWQLVTGFERQAEAAALAASPVAMPGGADLASAPGLPGNDNSAEPAHATPQSPPAALDKRD